MKKRVIFIFLFLISNLIFVLASCTKSKTYDIVTTLYPQYDIAKKIVGDKLSVTLLTPFGSEIHDFEPSAKAIVNVKESKLFIYTSNELEPWAKSISSDVNTLNIKGELDEELTTDFHFWTDPIVILELIELIKNRIINIDYDNKDYYLENANNYKQEILDIHLDLNSYLSSLSKFIDLYFYGHNALNAFASRYNIRINSLSESFKPDSELTPNQLKTLKNKIIDNHIEYLFIEELIDRRGVNSLINELKNEGYIVDLLELHSYHNITSNQNKEGISYADLFRQNSENIKRSLGA